MPIHLVDTSADVVEAWRASFRDRPEIDIQCADILAVAENTIVSPANSYGFMDGGIDRLYTAHFGLTPQTEIQKIIADRKDEHLPVGEAVLVRTGNVRVPYMIAAPTMQSPGPVPASNCFFAMAAILNAIDRHGDLINEVYCPGLGTMTGKVAPHAAAEEMAAAYRKWQLKPNKAPSRT